MLLRVETRSRMAGDAASQIRSALTGALRGPLVVIEHTPLETVVPPQPTPQQHRPLAAPVCPRLAAFLVARSPATGSGDLILCPFPWNARIQPRATLES